jgi:hypothetical protein
LVPIVPGIGAGTGDGAVTADEGVGAGVATCAMAVALNSGKASRVRTMRFMMLAFLWNFSIYPHAPFAGPAFANFR